jgi:ketosteroid isomerase-like protein
VSQANVEIVRHVYQGSASLIDAAHVAPDAEFDFTAVYPDQPVLRGIEAMRTFRDAGPWGRSTRFEPERYLEVDEERVLVLVRAIATGRGSGVPVETSIAQEFTIRDGLIVRVKVHRDQSEAVKAVGLGG